MRSLYPGFVEIDVGVGVVPHDGGRMFYHGAGDVGVQVQRYDDGDCVAEDAARYCQQRTLDIVHALGRLRAVHRQK